MNDVAKQIFGFITELCDYILKFTKLLVKCEKKNKIVLTFLRWAFRSSFLPVLML